MDRGRLITLEGIDGAGKTTQAARLHAELERRGVPAILLREPGGVALAERLRAVVKDPAATITPRAEALIYAAARAALVEERIRPALDDGTWVLLDRFVDSSLAYQGGGRALGVEEVRAINGFATGHLVPDRTVLLRLEPGAGRVRQGARGEAPDRLEREGEGFFAAIAATYDRLAAEEPDRFRVVDAAPPPDECARAVLAAVEDLLPPGGAAEPVGPAS